MPLPPRSIRFLPPLAAAALAAALGLGVAHAAGEEFSIDPAHTFATFEVGHLGIATQRGRFNATSGKVLMDAQAGTGSVDVSIDSRSVDTGNEAMEKLLRGSDFFNVEQFPTITYRSRSITFAEGKPQRIDGELTLLGVTRPVPLMVQGYACTRLPFLVQTRCGMDAVATFRRSEFNMSSLARLVSDEVKLSIQAEAVLPPKPQATE